MITVTDRTALRSIANEAGRQSAFYTTRQITQLAELWGEIESLTYDALQNNRGLKLILVDRTLTILPIKPGE